MINKIQAEDILNLFDAKVWANSFISHIKEYPGVPSDVKTMEVWFVNVMSAGYDKARLEQEYEDSDFTTFDAYLDSLT